MIYQNFQNLKLSALGLGAMRLPALGDNLSKIDEAAAAVKRSARSRSKSPKQCRISMQGWNPLPPNIKTNGCAERILLSAQPYRIGIERMPNYASISRIRLTISIAPSAQSYPLFPAFVPARSMACSIFSVVTTPNMTGTPVSSETAAIPLDTSLHT